MNIKPLAPIMDKATTTGSYIASISTAIGGFLSLDKIALLLGIASTIVLFVVQYRLSREKETAKPRISRSQNGRDKSWQPKRNQYGR